MTYLERQAEIDEKMEAQRVRNAEFASPFPYVECHLAYSELILDMA
ncbi:unnamed protein product, partial [marine sediment metagenome]